MNPLFLILRSLLPYLAAFGAGVVSMHYVDSLRLEHLQADFTSYQQKVDQDRLDADKHQFDLQEKTNAAWAQNMDVLKRCYDSGKCGVRHAPTQASGTGIKVPYSGGVDGAGPNAVPAAAGATAEEELKQLKFDCAKTTLMINTIQSQVEQQ